MCRSSTRPPSTSKTSSDSRRRERRTQLLTVSDSTARPQFVGGMGSRWALLGYRDDPRCPEMGHPMTYWERDDPPGDPGGSSSSAARPVSPLRLADGRSGADAAAQ